MSMRFELKVSYNGSTRTFFLAFGKGRESDGRDYTVTMMPLPESSTSKIPLIKELRAWLQVGLKEAKDLVDMAPSVLAENVSKDKAEELAKHICGLTEVKIAAS